MGGEEGCEVKESRERKKEVEGGWWREEGGGLKERTDGGRRY